MSTKLRPHRWRRKKTKQLDNEKWAFANLAIELKKQQRSRYNCYICLNSFSDMNKHFVFIEYILWSYKVKSEPEQLISKCLILDYMKQNIHSNKTGWLSVNRMKGSCHKLEMQIRNWSFAILFTQCPDECLAFNGQITFPGKSQQTHGGKTGKKQKSREREREKGKALKWCLKLCRLGVVRRLVKQYARMFVHSI